MDFWLFLCYNSVMISKSDKELQAIISEFEAPELILVRAEDAGPDDELWLLKSADGALYGLWARDYMSELEFEANGLKNNFGISVKEWVKLKNPSEEDEYVLDCDGDSFALFCY